MVKSYRSVFDVDSVLARHFLLMYEENTSMPQVLA